MTKVRKTVVSLTILALVAFLAMGALGYGAAGASSPNITVAGVPGFGSIGVRLDLPLATASVPPVNLAVKFEITVTDPDGNPATQVDPAAICAVSGFVQRDGFTNEDAIFDNEDNMFFYPRISGNYSVTYQAVTYSALNGLEVGRSILRGFEIAVYDHHAPVFLNTAQMNIPTQWGRSVVDENGEPQDARIWFPMPEVIDNYDAEEDLKVEFIVFNPNLVEILRFSNIFGDQNMSNNIDYDEGLDQIFTEDGFYLDFGKYNPFALCDCITGDFVVEYRARDRANNIGVQKFVISVIDVFEICGDDCEEECCEEECEEDCEDECCINDGGNPWMPTLLGCLEGLSGATVILGLVMLGALLFVRKRG